MSKHVWVASLVAVLVGASAGVARAESPKAPAAQRSGMGIVAMPTLRQQIKTNATQSGMWAKGTTLRLKYNEGKSQVSASLWQKTRWNGTPTPMPAPKRELMATAQFKVEQVSEGKLAVPVKQYGQVWHPVYRALNTASAAKAK